MLLWIRIRELWRYNVILAVRGTRRGPTEQRRTEKWSRRRMLRVQCACVCACQNQNLYHCHYSEGRRLPGVSPVAGIGSTSVENLNGVERDSAIGIGLRIITEVVRYSRQWSRQPASIVPKLAGTRLRRTNSGQMYSLSLVSHPEPASSSVLLLTSNRLLGSLDTWRVLPHYQLPLRQSASTTVSIDGRATRGI